MEIIEFLSFFAGKLSTLSGADAFFPKPIDFDGLISKINELICQGDINEE